MGPAYAYRPTATRNSYWPSRFKTHGMIVTSLGALKSRDLTTWHHITSSSPVWNRHRRHVGGAVSVKPHLRDERTNERTDGRTKRHARTNNVNYTIAVAVCDSSTRSKRHVSFSVRPSLRRSLTVTVVWQDDLCRLAYCLCGIVGYSVIITPG